MRKTIGPLLVLILSLFFSSFAIAEEELQPIEDLYSAARLFVYQQTKVANNEDLEVSVNNLDSRLTLRKCALPVEAFLPPSVNANPIKLVGVRCNNPVSWSLYIPVKTAINTKVITSAKLLPVSHIISSNDLEWVKQDKTQLHHGYYQSEEELLGKVIKRPLAAGAVITPDIIQSQQVIKRGDTVSIVASIGGLTVKSKGLAMQGGEIGETIKIKNQDSKRVIEAIVASAGTVKVPM